MLCCDLVSTLKKIYICGNTVCYLNTLIPENFEYSESWGFHTLSLFFPSLLATGMSALMQHSETIHCYLAKEGNIWWDQFCEWLTLNTNNNLKKRSRKIKHKNRALQALCDQWKGLEGPKHEEVVMLQFRYRAWSHFSHTLFMRSLICLHIYMLIKTLCGSFLSWYARKKQSSLSSVFFLSN